MRNRASSSRAFDGSDRLDASNAEEPVGQPRTGVDMPPAPLGRVGVVRAQVGAPAELPRRTVGRMHAAKPVLGCDAGAAAIRKIERGSEPTTARRDLQAARPSNL